MLGGWNIYIKNTVLYVHIHSDAWTITGGTKSQTRTPTALLSLLEQNWWTPGSFHNLEHPLCVFDLPTPMQ